MLYNRSIDVSPTGLAVIQPSCLVQVTYDADAVLVAHKLSPQGSCEPWKVLFMLGFIVIIGTTSLGFGGG